MFYVLDHVPYPVSSGLLINLGWLVAIFAVFHSGGTAAFVGQNWIVHHISSPFDCNICH